MRESAKNEQILTAVRWGDAKKRERRWGIGMGLPLIGI